MTGNSTLAAAKPTTLSNETLTKIAAPVRTPRYDRSKVSAGIVHIGVGNFFRAHEALYVEKCLELPGQQTWGIVGVGLGDGADKKAKVEAVNSQDGLYTLTEFAPDGAASVRVVGSLLKFLHGPSSPKKVLEQLASPETKIVSLTITEGGYNIDEATNEFVLSNADVQHDLANPQQPKTAFGFIVEALAARKSSGLNGFTVLSCDNLRSNGKVAKKAVVAFARARSPELAQWIEANVSFPNSMVDRIAPSVGPAEVQKVNQLSGIQDLTPVTGETFSQWVVEDEFIAGRPAFEQVGVELRDDVEMFEAMKGRLLNASHMMLSYPALMCGFRIVDEAMREPAVVDYLSTFLEKDVMPIVEGPRGVDLNEYKRNIIARFENPAIGDTLIRIANNGAAKLPIFLSKSLGIVLGQGGMYERFALCFAAFEQYLKGSDVSGGALSVDEPNLTADDKALLSSSDPLAVMKISAFAPIGLAENEAFVTVFSDMKKRLHRDGAIAALRHVVEVAK
ncbi:mannitol dehydrogenase family protein [Rhizobium rhizogenes]|uniref:Mannitol dehydrogenase family protein n=1 Tax=Rhizobium rhizogenes TaxID=359 RepID=A0AA92BZT3_RHIRH|nr:mannitol dehydrogenase family protein [Rhizobium rhizogenes]PVE50613.1 mannitol dehydrogenase family protein [Rhizobium rhizogenes]PVE62386.1 mannitol dehydrogenase family protein [Agrobacterium tumefaciens]PVE70569.1 mannitol dehydrogenase family protein [Sphingomonas sp. TPD3009]